MTNFMQDENEFLLLMNHTPHSTTDGEDTYHTLTTAEKVRLYNAGIRTAHEQPAWSWIEPQRGVMDLDDYLNPIIWSNRNAGLKSLIQFSGWRPPTWMPNSWFAKTINGKIEREALSLWNEDAQDYSDSSYKWLANHYKNEKDVQFFFGEYQGGEGAYPPTWPLYDDAAIQDYKRVYGTDAMPKPDDPDTLRWYGEKIVEHFRRKADILYPTFHEIWNAQQYLMDTWTKSFGNFVQPEILKAHRQDHPDACIVLLQYTYFDDSHDVHNEMYVDALKDSFGCEVIAEAMFCQGLKTTTPKAIAKGFRGQIVHPAKSSFENGLLEDWMVEEIRKSHDLWKASKGL